LNKPHLFAFLTARFSLPLPTVESVCPILVQSDPRETYFQLLWVGGIVKQLVLSQVFRLLTKRTYSEVRRLVEEVRRLGFFQPAHTKGNGTG